MRSIIDYVHHYMVTHKVTDGLYVDATCGNGYDTLFLARMLEGKGHIYALDIQKDAIDSTMKRTEGYGNISYHQLGHEHLKDVLSGKVDGILYNLGYLPGGDKSKVTRGETTVESLKQGLSLLNPGGIIGMVVYTGHPGGKEEETILMEYLHQLDFKYAQVVYLGFLNKGEGPYGLIIERLGI